MRFSRRRASGRGEEENPYWISFSDLMSALLLVFILAVVILVLQVMETQSELSAQKARYDTQQELLLDQVGSLRVAEDVRTEVLREIEAELVSRGIQVTVNEDNTVLSIPSSLLGFDSASYEIKPQYADVALTIGSVVTDVITEGDRQKFLDTVFVEGHTDSQAYEGLEGTGNWGLSTFRAISLWNLWGSSLPEDVRPNNLKTADGRPLFSVSGYADTRPANASQTTDADRSVNRRIDIRFTIIRPSNDDLLDIEERFVTESAG